MTDDTNDGVPPVPPVPPTPDSGAPDAAVPDAAVPPVTPPVAPPAGPPAGAYAPPAANPYATGPSAPGPYSPGPAAPSPYQAYSPAKPGAGVLAILALVIGILAFLFGLVPFVGAVFAIAGIVLGSLALRKPGGKGLSITGLSLAILALLTNILIIVVWFVIIPQAESAPPFGPDDSQFEVPGDEQAGGELTLLPVETPCFTFDGPSSYLNNISTDDAALCATQLELWGELENGEFVNTGVGAIYGSVYVEPIRAETTESWSTDGSVDGAVEYLEENYFPDFGTVTSLREPVRLGGEPANLSRFDSDSADTVTRAAIVSYSPSAYPTANGDVQFFLVSVTTVEDNGDAIIDAILDSWQWK
ncbi:DUF4190 domain-containing protein [Glaciihabitans arcticus]|uniref:DUF4190 domain-containing protein n=1 Tax=Glaciihabitans arcticus TaxID=2668039 RepID=A0A4Q9GQG2_9MICO|nr:DUF4190 domain-containing protein [Glaciihabitans arcticus]TBN57106.1 DUF4190 domain-containing protein [Glaciihabitans arcticus]